MKNENVMNRDLFNESIEAIVKQVKHDNESAEAFNKMFIDGDGGGGYNNTIVMEQFLKMISMYMVDNDDYDVVFNIITDYVWGMNIDEFESSDELYDYLIGNHKIVAPEYIITVNEDRIKKG